MSLSGIFSFTPLGAKLQHKFSLAILGVTSIWTVQRILRRLAPLPQMFRRLRLWPRSLNGKSVLLDPTDASHIIIFREIFVEHIYKLAEVPFVPDLILDCGGHIGLFTLLAQHHFPSTRAMVFEPNSANLPYLKAQVEDNSINVEIIPSAVSDFDGQAQFSAGCSCSGSIRPSPELSSHDRSVPVVNLCKLLSEMRPQQLVLKMDIEGGEEILLPAILPLLPRKTVLLFETHYGAPSWEKHSQSLGRAGFVVTQTSNRDRYSDGVAIRN